MPGQWFTPVGEYIRYIPHNIYALLRSITDAMCAEHDCIWLSAVTAFYKFALDKISENFVKIYMKILNLGRLLKIYIT